MRRASKYGSMSVSIEQAWKSQITEWASSHCRQASLGDLACAACASASLGCMGHSMSKARRAPAHECGLRCRDNHLSLGLQYWTVTIRLVLAEDNLLVREGVRRLLEAFGDGIELVAACGDLPSLMDAV